MCALYPGCLLMVTRYQCLWCLWLPMSEYQYHFSASNPGKVFQWECSSCLSIKLRDRSSFSVFFFFFAHGLPRPGIRSKLCCDLCCSYGNARSLTCCAGPGMEPMSRCLQDATNPIAPQWEFSSLVFFCFVCLFVCFFRAALAAYGKFQD